MKKICLSILLCAVAFYTDAQVVNQYYDYIFTISGNILADNAGVPKDNYVLNLTSKDGFILSNCTIKPGVNGAMSIKVGLNPGQSDDDMNSVQTTFFDELGNAYSQSKTFFDNGGNVLQSQSKSFASGHVFASQPIYDKLNRVAISTLSAPIWASGFVYKSDFVQNVNGEPFDHSDIGPNANSALKTTEKGTLGWYYSDNNTLEPFQDKTTIPYTQNVFYKDASGEVQYSAGVGEAFMKGSGRESYSQVTKVQTEQYPDANYGINEYFNIRNTYMDQNDIDKFDVYQRFVNDVNGNEYVSYYSNDDKLLVSVEDPLSSDFNTSTPSLLPTGGVHVPNIKQLLQVQPEVHLVNLLIGGSHANNIEFVNLKVISDEFVEVFANSTLVFSGYPSRDQILIPKLNTTINYQIRSSKKFDVQYYKSETILFFLKRIIGMYRLNSFENSKQNLSSFYIPKNAYLVSASVQGNVVLNNVTNNTFQTYTNQQIQLLPGNEYRFRLPIQGVQHMPSYENAGLEIEYSLNESGQSYYYYNAKGMLITQISPNGLIQLRSGVSYANIDKTTYEYDINDRLKSTTSIDQGTSKFVYRKDGNIRFSQNEEQRLKGSRHFSYTNYDQLGRPIESGEFIANPSNPLLFENLYSIIETTGYEGGLSSGTRKSWVKSYYDIAPDNIPTELLNNYEKPTFLNGNIASVENENAQSWFSYDELGRVKYQARYIKGLDKLVVMSYKYDFLGNVLEVAYQKHVPSEAFYHYYTYDADKRLSKVQTSLDGITKTLQATYIYYLHGPLKRVELADKLQGIDYVYNIHGMLKSINHPETSRDPGKDGANGFSQDVFGMTLEYYNGDYTRSGTNIASIDTQRTDYSGNIQGQTWRVAEPTISGGTLGIAKMQVFDYDTKYQLTGSQMAVPSFVNRNFSNVSNAFSERGLTYDANGNIKTLQRYNGTGDRIHNFNYTYQPNTNKLLSISGYHYVTYLYDARGNMIRQEVDPQEQDNIFDSKAVEYDVTGKVVGVSSGTYSTDNPIGWSYELREIYEYDDSGYRLLKKNHDTGHETWYINDASGNLIAIYEKQGTAALIQTELPVYGGSRIGIYKKQGGISTYELKDHLGTVRAIINRGKRSNGLADVVYSADYYPFGEIAQRNGDPSRFGYQGEYAEKDGETEWHAFDLRMYDTRIGRWLSTDPYEQFWSPYNGMGNNPINEIDPDGGWSFLGAVDQWVLAKFRGEDPGKIYKVNDEWGFSTSSVSEIDGVSGFEMAYNFGYDRPKSPNLEYLKLKRFAKPWGDGPAPGSITPVYWETSFMPIAPVKGVQISGTLFAAKLGDKVIPKGFKEVKDFGKSHGQPVYKKGEKYISRDVGQKDGSSHNGGVWKELKKVGTKLKRTGTLDENLKRMKD